MKTILLFIGTLSFLAVFCQNKPINGSQKQLIGRWISTDDKAYQIIFKDSVKQDYYGTKLHGYSAYWVRNDSLIVKDLSDGEMYYYAIMSLSKTNLTLMYLERGNLLKFRRK